MCAFEHQVFWPSIRQPVSVFVALHFSPPTSDPASGSDIEIDSTSPRHIPPSSSCFWASMTPIRHS